MSAVAKLFNREGKKGFKLGDKVIHYKFAYFPTKLNTGKWIWFKEYKERNRIVDGKLVLIDRVEVVKVLR